VSNDNTQLVHSMFFIITFRELMDGFLLLVLHNTHIIVRIIIFIKNIHYIYNHKFTLHPINISINWHSQSNIVSLRVHRKVFIDNYTTSIFLPIKYITPKTYYYIAPFKIYELVERTFLCTLIVRCPCYKNTWIQEL